MPRRLLTSGIRFGEATNPGPPDDDPPIAIAAHPVADAFLASMNPNAPANMPQLPEQQQPVFFTPLETMPEDEQDYRRSILPLLVELQIRAAPIKSRTPFQSAPAAMVKTWRAATRKEALLLEVAIDAYHAREGDYDLTMLNAVLHLVQLPARILGPLYHLAPPSGLVNVIFDKQGTDTMEIDLGPPQPRPIDDAPYRKHQSMATIGVDDKEKSMAVRAAQSTVQSAQDCLYKGRRRLATKILIGNGCAPQNKQTANLLRDMHPTQDDPLERPEAYATAQARPDEGSLYEINKKRAGERETPSDAFAWSYSLLYHERNETEIAGQPTTFMHQIGRLQSLLFDLPVPIMRIFTYGNMTALNKLPMSEQAARIATGLSPKIRPINSGSIFLVTPLKSLSASNAGKAAIKDLAPIQCGLGTPNGPELVVHTLRDAYARDYVILTQDAANAFNTLDRNAMSRAFEVRAPLLKQAFDSTYAHPSTVTYITRDENDGAITAHCMESQTGARMGCAFASFSFAITTAPVYTAVQLAVPKAIVRALTDDMPVAIPPADPATNRTWDDVYDDIVTVTQVYDTNANAMGLYRNLGKGHILLPPNAPMPTREHPIHAIADITYESIKVAGATIGTAAAVKAACLTKVHEVTPRINAAVRLGTVNPQAAVRIITSGTGKAIDYTLRSTPPGLAIEAATLFDETLQNAITDTLQLTNHDSPYVEPVRQARTNTIISLPTSTGGFGLTPAAKLAPIAFISSLVSVLTNTTTPPISLLGLLPDTTEAFAMLANTLGVLPAAFISDPYLSTILPPDAAALLSGSFAKSASPALNPLVSRRLQGTLIAERARIDKLTLLTAYNIKGIRKMAGKTPPEVTSHTTLSDIVHVHLLLSRSQWTRVLNADLQDTNNRVNPVYFVNSARYYLNLPPLLRPSLTQDHRPGHGRVNFCCADHQVPQHIDPTGDHAVSCITIRKSRSNMHSALRSTVARFGREANCDVQVEPQTQDILDNKYTAAQCSTMFVRDPTTADKARATKVQRLVDRLHKSTSAATQADLRRQIQEMVAAAPGKLVGLRLDVVLTSPDGLTGPAFVDVGFIHPTAASYLSQQATFVHDCLNARLAADPRASVNEMSDMNSHALGKSEHVKQARYASIVSLATALSASKKTPPPQFFAALITHSGELSNDLIKLVEWVTAAYRYSMSGTPFFDGISPKRRVGLFRQRFKDNLMVVLANGFGRSLTDVGVDRPIAPPPGVQSRL
jgi:hypothetical protein